MYYNAQLLGAVNNLYDVNDRLGVELMGAGSWSGLKKAVTNMTASTINKSQASRISDAAKKISSISSKNKVIDISGYNTMTLNGDDALCRELFGFNDNYAVELLGRNWAGRMWDGVKEATHQVLNIGAKVPVTSGLVEAIRDTADTIKGTKKAAEVATIAYDNRGKIILIGGGAAILLYLLLRKKKGRR